MRRRIVLFTILLVMTVLNADPINPFPAIEYEGAYDYFILSKSLLADNVAQDYEDGIHQGDTSLGIAGTTAVLKDDDVPPDALIEKAILVWVVSKDDSDKMAFCDNSVTLVTPDGTETDVVGPEANSATPASFTFEAYWKSGYYYYVYRTDVTETILNYQTSTPDLGDIHLSGNYTVKGVDDIHDCSAESGHAYCSSASMVGSWQLIFIYSSKDIARKRLYMYNGMDWSSNTMFNPLAVEVTNFELPEAATVKISFVTSDGDDVASAAEFLKMRGNKVEDINDLLVLADECNPPDQPFNNNFRNYNYKNEPSACAPEFSYDIDTFLLQYDESDTSDLINKHIAYGTTSIWFLIGSGADIVLTNYVMLSVDTKLPAFDIPDVDEKQLLTGSTDTTLACDDRPFAYEIRVENHGSEPAVNVMVQDELPSALKYIPASTQIDRTGTGRCYEPLADVAGESPLQNGIKVADTLEICQSEDNCSSILLRFKAEPMLPPKHAIYNNIAKIWDDKSTLKYAYLTNQNLPVRTKVDFDCAETTKKLYTPESTACDGVVVVPDDDNESQDDSVDDTNSDSDSETDTQTDDDMPPFEDESGCGCNLIL